MLTKQEYEDKRQARYERLLAAAEKAERESQARRDHAHQMAECIPFGQPILVGHYSEGRDRNFRARIDSNFRKGFELYERSQELKSRAKSIEDNTSIFSDDPEATEKIGDRIAKLEALQEQYKAVNVAYKKFLKDPASLDTSNIPESTKTLLRNFKPEWSGDKPIPAYRLTNNNANIRRLKERAQVVERKQATADSEQVINGVRIEYVPSENRVRLHFPCARVSHETYKELQHAGFRHSKTLECFSAFYNANAKYYAEQIAGKFTS